ncbi:MAG TPA: carbohydrate kinase family protein [Anaerolineae bacterium]|nr:carbohydrate kinase family protein [Anaerolineae bacterium]
MPLDVVVIGPLNVDLLITGSAPTDMDELTRWAGPSNVMLAAAGSAGYIVQDLVRLDLRAGVVSVLADDPFGDAVLRVLRESGVDAARAAREPETLSGIGIYMLLFGSKKRPLTYRLPTHRPWPVAFAPGDLDYVFGARHLHCAGYLHFPDMWSDRMADLFRQAKARGLSTSLDPQFVLFPVDTPWMEPLVDLLRFTDLLMLDEDEARQVAQTDDLRVAARVLRDAGPPVVVIKRGAQGSLVHTGERTFEQAAVTVPEEEIVETIGAGDAFDAGLIVGHLAGWPIERSAQFATLAAASTLRGSGGTQSLASRAELERALQSTSGD